jgi:hypothetical protein
MFTSMNVLTYLLWPPSYSYGTQHNLVPAAVAHKCCEPPHSDTAEQQAGPPPAEILPRDLSQCHPQGSRVSFEVVTLVSLLTLEAANTTPNHANHHHHTDIPITRRPKALTLEILP